MEILYLDCFSGISGDMFLSALVDLGIDSEWLKSELSKLPLDFELLVKKVKKQHIVATQIEVIDRESVPSHTHHPHRPAKELLRIIDQSPFPPKVKTKAKEIISKIAQAEAKIHDQNPEEVHLHEVGGVDTLIDITGTILALDRLGIQQVIASPVVTGRGMITTAHGVLPVPAPATLELLKGVPISSGTVEAELTTPTGAALISSLATSFGPLPEITIQAIGYGAGHQDLPLPNILRAIKGTATSSVLAEKNLIIETNIDDMSPQVVEHLSEKLFEAGALDVFTTPIFMKKYRPAFRISVIASPHLASTLREIIFTETTTLGIREYQVTKHFLSREEKEISTPWGAVRVKVVHYNQNYTVRPEYEDCKRIAQENGIPLQKVIETARERGEITYSRRPAVLKTKR